MREGTGADGADQTDDNSPRSEPAPLERARLAAVVFTDVVSYSARMQKDEASTISAVHADFTRMREACDEKGGEVLNTMGDGMMLCFGSAVDAVSFALQIQEEFGDRNAKLPSGVGLKHRVGIHIGDVRRVEGGHVAGDGVNIAARLESRAPHGGICISQIVYDTVKGKVPMKSHSMGPQTFKNIAEPLVVYSIEAEGKAKAVAPVVVHKAAAPTNSSRRSIFGVVGVVLGLLAAEQVWRHKDTLFSGERGTADPNVVGDKAIAVLPFTNAGSDKETGFFTDGFHQDVLTQLSLLADLKVVSRGSVADFRNTNKNSRQIGKELGVGSLVAGSVRREGDQLRVTAELIDVRSDKRLWSGKYERDYKDVFAVQSAITSSVAAALKASVSPQEQLVLARRPTENLQAYELLLRRHELANVASSGSKVAATLPQRISLLTQAVALDPKLALGWAHLAADRAMAVKYGVGPEAETRNQAQKAMSAALALAPNDMQVKLDEGALRLHGLHEPARALQAYSQVVKALPNNVAALHGVAEAHSEMSGAGETVVAYEVVLGIDPRHFGALNRLAQIYTHYRQFARAQALRLQMAETRLEDPDLRAEFFRNEYSATGSWNGYDNWRNTLGKGAESKLARIRDCDVERAVAKRDFVEVRRLLELAPEDTKGAVTALERAGLETRHALAWVAAGERAKGTAAATAVLRVLDAELRKTPSGAAYYDKAAMHALLGQKPAAMAALNQAAQQTQKLGGRYAAEALRHRVIDLHALLGERGAALDELRRRLGRPGLLVHDLDLRLELFPLWQDPGFRSILKDPASNTPLQLTLKV